MEGSQKDLVGVPMHMSGAVQEESPSHQVRLHFGDFLSTSSMIALYESHTNIV